MEAHRILKENDFIVSSYGVGTQVKLPGPAQDQPNSYPFGTLYADILEDLKRKDISLYTRNGLIQMLERNMKIKVHIRQECCVLCFSHTAISVCPQACH